MNIAYAADEKYARYAAISMVSLFENNKEVSDITVYIIENNISNESKKILLELANKYNRKMIFLPLKDLINGLVTDGTFSLASFARLFLCKILNIDKILYLDCDMIVLTSLDELWNISMDGNYFAGVMDSVERHYRKEIGLSGNDEYINAGMLLMNLSELRKIDWQGKVIAFVNEFNGKVPHHDQGVVNALGKGKIKILSPKYNSMDLFFWYSSEQAMKITHTTKFYTQVECDEAVQQPVIIHYTAGYYGRPWDVKCTHPLKEAFIKYMNKTIYNGQLVDEKENRNVVLMRKLYKILPFGIYCKVVDLKEFIKRICK
ncbi:MAG: glycosyltransferase family 8 protein [Oscillospiraceae bacterium]